MKETIGLDKRAKGVSSDIELSRCPGYTRA
jgi:hypothetical protein